MFALMPAPIPTRRLFLIPVFILFLFAALVRSPIGWAAETANPSLSLVGTWEATRHFGPELRGSLLITRGREAWVAEIAGLRAPAPVHNQAVHCVFPGGRGEFQGVLDAKPNEIRGHWIQPPTVNNGMNYASPVVLTPRGKDRWQGEVTPLEDEFTLYLVANAKDDGSVGAFLQNPDRNIGVFLIADRIERSGDAVRLIGHNRGDDKNKRVLAEGTYRPGANADGDRFTLYFPTYGGSYDFARAVNHSFFYARGKKPSPYRYMPPPAEDDGWPIGTLAEAAISEAPLQRLIEEVIDPPAKSVHDPYLHGMLVARHGKLVFEEYFHGFHRERPHDTRSASKSLTATLVGSVIEHGGALSVSTPVYRAIYGDHVPAGLDPWKKAMTVENLLMMASGYYCDDRDPKAPGNEDVMQDQTADPDWYQYTLNVPMNANPGEQPVYCSADANLLGDVLQHVTDKPLAALFQERIADPLQIKRYYLDLSPIGDPYMGGGIYWLPRDFMKLAQVMLDGGMWNGQRIVSAEWARRATSPLENLRKIQYGYLWWSISYPYKGQTVHAFFAGGNGGQIVMGIPELDLVVAFYAGNYSDPVLYKIQQDFVPEYILPAIDASPAP